MAIKLRLSMILLAAACLPAPASQAAEPDRPTLRERIAGRHAGGEEPALPLGAGTHALQLRHGGLSRKVLVHVPAGYDPARPAPLVLAFHGGGGHAEYMADDAHYGLVAKAEREGFVVAFPNGYSRFPRGRLATWNAGGCCGDARDRAVDDVGFVRAVVARVRSQVAIDGSRVFAAGMSNGGMLAHRLACEAPDVFRAVASVAGTDATANCAPSRPASVLHIHARNDTHVLFTGGAGEDAFRDAAKVMDFVSVPETVARWVKRNQCNPAPRRILENPGAYCEAYSGCSGGVSVQLCVTEQGGHSWPGAKTVRRGKEAASRALDANDVLWDFFARTGVAAANR